MTRAAIVTAPIDTAAVLREVESPAHGASILFVGTVREVNDGRPVQGMDYTAYVAMAEKEMAAIAREAAAKFPESAVVIVHRIGELAIGEASVAVATAHAHRDAAYGASRYAIEQLKKRVPIWKREHYADGTREWIDPTRSSLRSSGQAPKVSEPQPS
ncbi:MAG TPA: molybdenum cofactor biosynthesis protein MoaE [Gemmatimonadaceae bacterium]|nr:molybdenum cofactor biosynthesis protein MoaE [Gemmatimonadaceae bacterium]